MTRLLFKVILLLFITTDFAQGSICSLCNCFFSNVSQLEENLTGNLEINDKFKIDSAKPFNLNSSQKTLSTYFYVDCSNVANVDQMNSTEWPALQGQSFLANFENSKLKELKFLPENVRNQMSVLLLNNNLIVEMDEFDMDGFIELKMLNLSQNKIKMIKKSTFSKVNLLRILDLSENEITEIAEWSFYNSQLEYLNLSKNNISNIMPGTFRGLVNLKVLDLSENKLSKLFNDFSNILPSLMILILRKNTFEILPELPKSLKKFDGSQNSLTDIHLSHLNLEVLDISNNELKSLEHISFPQLKILKADRNNLSQLEDVKSNHIEILNLSYNKLSKIPKVINSDKIPFLRELYLDGNPITNLSFPMQQVPFSDLKVLSLSHLKSFKKILKNSFHGVIQSGKKNSNCSTEKGLTLDFSHNSIKFIDKDAFQNFTVCSIDLSNNNLKTLSQNLLPWSELSYVNLQENPWQCDCNIQWMLDDFLKFMYVNHPRLLFHMRCATPKRLEGKLFAFWYNRTNQVFCDSSSHSFYLNLVGDKQIEIWTASAVACIVLTCIIFAIAVAIIVIVCRKPKFQNQRRKEALSKKKVKQSFYSKIEDKKDDEFSEKHV